MTEIPAVRLSPPAFLHERGIAPILAALPGARVVGGAVRDTLAATPVSDIDVGAPQPPDEVVRRLEGAGFRTIPTGLAHGTVTAISDGHPVEITTLRRDVETDGRHAVVAFTDDWQADAARRDFTINAMSMRGDGAVFDYFEGIADLRAGKVRFVGDPATRISEDYLRILRYFRFFARYARETPDPTTLAAIREGMSGLPRLSPERVWNELKRILAAHDPSAAVALMAQLGVLQAVLPEGADSARLTRMISHGAPDDPLLRFAALLTGDAEHVADRLKLSGEERDALLAWRSGPVPRPHDDDAALRRLLAEQDQQVLLGRSWIEGDEQPGWAEMRSRLTAMPRPVFPLQGRDVLALGLPPGPPVGQLLHHVRTWWLAGGCTANREACLQELAHIAKVPPNPPRSSE